MTGRPIQPLTKISAARAQLMTALELFVRDKDPVSVQCLACGGGEILEGMAVAELGEEALVMAMLSASPQFDAGKLRSLKHRYWNAFKHLADRKGLQRDDETLLSKFSDEANDAALFVGWWDYMSIQKKLPVAAQVFQIWWVALYTPELAKLLNNPGNAVSITFPDLAGQPRKEQKRRLRRAVEKWRGSRDLIAHPATEPD